MTVGNSIVAIVTYLLHHLTYTVELQWLEHLWDHTSKFETGVVRASEG